MRLIDSVSRMAKRRSDRKKSGGVAAASGNSLLTEDDIYLFNEGSHFRLWEKLGSHLCAFEGKDGAQFGVWAPDAASVSVMGDFNDWNKTSHPLAPRYKAGIWESFVPDVKPGAIYKYHVVSNHRDYRVDKADPFAQLQEMPPRTGSVVWDLDYAWGDEQWMDTRRERNALDAPMAIYEVHLGSWRRVADDNNRSLSYEELATELVDYVKEIGFTHVELLPVMEHPFFGSWGYQTTGYFAPSSRFGTPQELMHLIDALHQNGIGVILDWVPSHFPADQHGLGFFDGSHLYEHADPRQGIHPDWDSFIFNYDRSEVRSFLISSALFWLEKYHVDGLRVDAVASMLYLDYSRKDGEWIPNEFGGNENIGAISFLRRFNEAIYEAHPDVQTVAEESTAWPMVSRPGYLGGLGFGLKWDMGWMHDTLKYLSRDPVHRGFHHDQLTFRMVYAANENFVLPLSHDEVVHGKGSLLGKMPGDEWQQFANLRLLLAYMYGQPGKKLLFMGGEFGQRGEWDHDGSLDWHALDNPLHAGLRLWVGDLNHLYRTETALHEQDCQAAGFEWIDCTDAQQSVISFARHGTSPGDTVIAIYNFTPVPREHYRLGAPRPGRWTEALVSDSEHYGGSGQGNLGGLDTEPIPLHGHPQSLNLMLPPLSAVFLKTDKASALKE